MSSQTSDMWIRAKLKELKDAAIMRANTITMDYPTDAPYDRGYRNGYRSFALIVVSDIERIEDELNRMDLKPGEGVKVVT